MLMAGKPVNDGKVTKYTSNFEVYGGNIMENIIGAIVLGILSIACFAFSYLQFNEKGFLFNNAYIYASKHEREVMDKKPYYRQSGSVFIMIGIIFAINAVDIILKTGWLFYVVIVIAIIDITYAIVSSIIIDKNKR